MKKLVLFYGCLVSLTACFTDPKHGSNSIELTQKKPENKNCVFLDKVTSDEDAPYASKDVYRNNYIALENMAYEMKGNVVSIESKDKVPL